jgi:hypothetical protein
MESATIIIFFTKLVHFQVERGVVKKSTHACDNDEKDGRPLRCPIRPIFLADYFMLTSDHQLLNIRSQIEVLLNLLFLNIIIIFTIYFTIPSNSFSFTINYCKRN